MCVQDVTVKLSLQETLMSKVVAVGREQYNNLVIIRNSTVLDKDTKQTTDAASVFSSYSGQLDSPTASQHCTAK